MKAAAAMSVVPMARPSRPSVMFTALLAATTTSTAKTT